MPNLYSVDLGSVHYKSRSFLHAYQQMNSNELIRYMFTNNKLKT